MFSPFGFMGTQAGGGAPTNPVTSNLVFGVEFGPGQSYPGSGTTVTDSSTFGITGVLGAAATYTSNRYINFTSTATSDLLFTGTFSQLGFQNEWTVFAYLKLANTTDSVYISEKSTNPGFDTFSLVGNYDAGAVRPWNNGYRGMSALSIGTTLASVAFTKDANGVANNYKSYKDGSNVVTISSDFSLLSNTTGVEFNNFDLGSFDLYNFYYYDRAISAAEVTSLHNYVTSY